MTFKSNIYITNSEFEKAHESVKEAEIIALKLNEISRIAQIKIIKANTYLIISDLEKSIGYFYESLKLFEEIESKRGIYTALNGIGIVYHDQKNLKKAEECFLKCHAIITELKDSSNIAATLNNLASTYSQGGQLEKSIRFYLEAIEINKKHGNNCF